MTVWLMITERSVGDIFCKWMIRFEHSKTHSQHSLRRAPGDLIIRSFFLSPSRKVISAVLSADSSESFWLPYQQRPKLTIEANEANHSPCSFGTLLSWQDDGSYRIRVITVEDFQSVPEDADKGFKRGSCFDASLSISFLLSATMAHLLNWWEKCLPVTE